jgi:hypothetical protein
VSGGFVEFRSADNFKTSRVTLDGGGLKRAPDNSADISGIPDPIGANGATFDTNGNDVNLASALSGGPRAKTEAGTLAFSAANVYTGGTTAKEDLVEFKDADNFGTGRVTLDGGGLKWAAGAGSTFKTNGNAHSLDNGALTANGENATCDGDPSAKGATVDFIVPVAASGPVLRLFRRRDFGPPGKATSAKSEAAFRDV